MKKQQTQSIDDKQHRRFVEAARELQTDDDPEAFKRRLKKLMDAPPPDENVPGNKKKPKSGK